MLSLYIIKKDSADGRLLIWRIAISMIIDKPIFGFGPNGFEANYMSYQADFFEEHPDSSFILLADNISNPFNEWVRIGINYGITGIVIVICLLILAWKQGRKIQNKQRIIAYAIIIDLFCWSLFSYPFSIPFVWVTIASLTFSAYTRKYFDYLKRKEVNIVIFLASLSLIIIIYPSIRNRTEWGAAQAHSQRGNTKAALNDFRSLYNHLSGDGRFLYNYGAELHYAGLYEESKCIMIECTSILNDYNLQMILADDYMHIGAPDSAILHYQIASNMIPARFLPLYQMMCIYSERQQDDKAKYIAQQIINKPVKVNSRSTELMIDKAIVILNSKKKGI